MSDSSQVGLYQVPEVTYGTTPASALKQVRYTGESLNYNIQTVLSNEIRDDRARTDVIQVGADVEGSVNGELSYDAYDDWITGLMMAAWASTLTLTGVTISAASADNSFNFSASNSPAFVPGQWIKVSGFATAANNGYFQVVSRTAAKVVVQGGTLVLEAAGPSVTVVGTSIRNGTTKKSFTIEKKFADVSPVLYNAFTGCVVSGAELEISAGEVLRVTWNFMGKAGTLGTATAGTGGPTAAPTKQVLNATSNVGKIYDGNTVFSDKIRSIRISANNNVRGLKAVGVFGNFDVGLGSFDVTGTMQIYFANKTLYDKFVAQTRSAWAGVFTDADGNTYVLSLPEIEFNSMRIVAGGANQDVMVEAGFTALLDPTFSTTFIWDKFPVA